MRTIALAALAAIISCLSPGCSLARTPLNSEPVDGSNDVGIIEDGDVPDAPDAETPDADMPDADVDAFLVDAGDAGSDMDAGPDAGSDAGPVDSGPRDSGPPDTGPADAGPPDGCADGTVDQIYPGTRDMVGCDGARTQCLAGTLCDSGWHLCSFAEYQARGGMSVLGGNRWLSACVRTGCGSPTEPISGTCATCAVTLGTTATVRITCDVAMTAEESVACEVGVLTSGTIRHVGAPTTACSMATTAGTYVEYGATCCR